MSVPQVTRIVIVRHAQGLHARPAEIVARTAMQYTSRVEIVRDGRSIDAKSILNILTLGATQGVELTLQAQGDDASEAIDALARVVGGDFAEDEPEAQGQAG